MSHWLFAAVRAGLKPCATVAIVVVVATGSIASAQSAEQEVTNAEQMRLEARRKADRTALGRLSSDGLLVIGPSGQATGKKEMLAMQALPKLANSEVRTRVIGDVGIVTGIQSGLGANADQQHRFTRVWRKENGQWINVFSHVTRIQPPSTATPPAQTPAQTIAATQWPAGKTQDESDVIKTQRSLNELFARKDASAYGQLTADSYVRINTNGAVTSRAEFLEAVAATPDTKRVESNNSDIRVNVHGPVAIVTVIDKTPTSPAAGTRMTRIFAKQSGTWKQLVTQTTTIAPPQ